jgi:long-chain acyl-CoA synthetase
MLRPLPQMLADSAAEHPTRAALVAAAGVQSYAALESAVDAAAGIIAGLVPAGARLGLMLPNAVAMPVVLLGALRAGRSVVLLNVLYSPREVAECLADAGVDTVITVAPFRALLPSGTRAIVIDAGDAGIGLRADAGASREEGPGAAAPAPGDEAVVIYTAAQRGRARGARLTHRNLAANARATIEAMGLTPDDRVVAALPLMHAFGLTVTLLAPLAAGAAVMPVERFSPVRMLDQLEESGATVFAGVPSMFLALLAVAERREALRHGLRVAICGGAPLPWGTAERWEAAFGIPLRQGYGITEAGPVCLFNRVDRPNRPGSMGSPFPGVEAAVHDEAGNPLAAGEVGELCVRGENVFTGYVGEAAPPELRGGWLRTGDLAAVQPDGTFRFRGVLKPMFTRNGFNIYPHEIERVLEEEPRVRRVRVCALPVQDKENEIIVYVEPAAGVDLAEDEVRSFCRARLAAYKQPGQIVLGTIAEAF